MSFCFHFGLCLFNKPIHLFKLTISTFVKKHTEATWMYDAWLNIVIHISLCKDENLHHWKWTCIFILWAILHPYESRIKIENEVWDHSLCPYMLCFANFGHCSFGLCVFVCERGLVHECMCFSVCACLCVCVHVCVLLWWLACHCWVVHPSGRAEQRPTWSSFCVRVCVCAVPWVWASVLMSQDFISDERLFDCSFGWDLWRGPYIYSLQHCASL